MSNIDDFNEAKMDAIGEIENISMGAAATAVSTLLNAKVWITTPTVAVCKASEFSYLEFEPSVFVRIQYIKGISGSSLLILKQEDIQLILNQLMGMPLVVSENFEFDEINISAICEVMNQMMGASATALSKLINTFIDISTPEAIINSQERDILKLQDINPDDYICSVSFQLTIDNVISSKFVTILSIDLARELADKMMSNYNKEIRNKKASSKNQESPSNTSAASDNTMPAPSRPEPAVDTKPAVQPKIQTIPTSEQASQPPFVSFQNTLSQEELNNLQLLLNVPLELSIEIGSTQKKVDDILSFSNGTVVELDCPADTPVNVIVNGHLIAKGDVVVVDDHFAVRITEIIQSNLLDTLRNKEH